MLFLVWKMRAGRRSWWMAPAPFSGPIRRRSKRLGPVLEGEAPLLSAIWSPENGTTPEQFLAHWGRSPAGTVALKFLVKGGGTGVFSHFDLRLQQGGGEIFRVSGEAGSRRQATQSNQALEAELCAKAKTGLRAATGADGVAGFQQRADEHPRPHVVAAEQGRAGASVAAFADGGGKIRAARGGNRQRTRQLQPPGKGSAPRGAGKFERGGEPLRGFFPQRAPARPSPGTCNWKRTCSRRASTRRSCSRR